MDISTEDLEAFLNASWQRAGDAANTLPEQLLSDQQAALNLIATGSLGSVGKNSANQSYAGYSPGSLTQRQITRIFTTLIRYYQVVKDKIVKAAQKAVIDLGGFDFDPPIYNILIQYLQSSAIADVRGDITNLNIPVTLREQFPHQPVEVAW